MSTKHLFEHLSKTLIDESIQRRRHLHSIPELGLEEFKTRAQLIEWLTDWGYVVTENIGQTGFVATLTRGEGPAIGIRADMDALPIQETDQVEYASTHKQCMHACGHDGHMAIALGAAQYLSTHDCFRGTVHFVFQPAEENAGGGQLMVQDGLFERFPMAHILGLHNWPGLPAGEIAVNPGAMMASHDSFTITLTGKSCHAAMPHLGKDPIVAAAQLINALQSIISRSVAPSESAVISVTQMHSGDAMNVIPDQAVLRGTVRCLADETREKVVGLMASVVEQFLTPFGIDSQLVWEYGYPVTANHADTAACFANIARKAIGEDNVHWNVVPSMAAEDFSFLLKECPGVYFWLGADGDTPSPSLHNTYFDFNDELMTTGIALWVAVVEHYLAKSAE